MPLLPLAKIYCLRAVVASSVALLALFFPLYMNCWFLYSWSHTYVAFWLSFALTIFILLHHLLMSLNMEFFGGLPDVPLLLFEITGLGVHTGSLLHLMSRYSAYSLPSSAVHSAVSCILLICLSLEVILRIGFFVSFIQISLDPYHCSPMPDHTLDSENLKPYQIIFGHSMRRSQFSGTRPTTRALGGFYLTVKIFLLRLVLVSSVISLALSPFLGDRFKWDSLWLALLLLIILHHLLSCINFQFNYTLADLPFLVFEIAAITPPQTISNLGWIVVDPATASNPTMICYKFFSRLAFVGIVIETLLCATSVTKYFIHLIRWVRDSASVTPDFTTMVAVPKPQHVLFGKSLWRRHVVGETWLMILSRGVLVMISIFVLSVYSAIDIVISPVQENGALPVKDMRTPYANIIFQPAIWNMVFVHQLPGQLDIFDSDPPDMTEWDLLFQSAVSVTQLQDSGFEWIGWTDDSRSSPLTEHGCVYAPGFTYPDLINEDPHFRVSSIYCGSNQGDFLITINFTTLQIPVGTMKNMSLNSLQIMVGLNHDSYKVIERTRGTTLVPGTNLFGTFTREYRQVLKNPSLSTFGLFDSYDTIMVAQMLSIIPDPLESHLIPRSPEIATFRLLMPYDLSEIRTIQDYRTKSILQGLSAVGGLWTFLSGIIATIFGISIFKILFGGKPISFLGIAHALQRKEIKTEWKKKYREIQDQARENGFEGSLLSLLLDEVVDLDFLELERKKKGLMVPQDTNSNEENNESIMLQNRNQVDEG